MPHVDIDVLHFILFVRDFFLSVLSFLSFITDDLSDSRPSLYIIDEEDEMVKNIQSMICQVNFLIL
jgi:hypothetical protein